MSSFVGSMKVAIIGGGPSAFYVASRILSLMPRAVASSLKIHMYDRLWSPHGLVRYGVAPDHPEVKNCTHKFDAMAEDPRFRFFGNVNVGGAPMTPIPHVVQLSLSKIMAHYTHLIFATGCTLSTLHPAVPPSSYCVPALSLVHWYTQHPSCIDPPSLDKVSRVSLIGNGNVSLDIVRMLLTSPSVLETYDVPQPVLEELSRSAVRHVSIIGRRGPFEAAFTTKELRELMNLPDASMVPIDPPLLSPPPGSSLTRQQSRVLQLLQKGSRNAYGTTAKSWSLDFFRSPTGLVPPSGDSSMAQLTLEHTQLDPKTQRATPTGETSTIPTSLVVTSLGFHSEPTSPFYEPALGHLRTLSGRVVSSSGNVLKNVYASGWAATGAKGVLASTMMNAYAVADTVLSDWLPRGDMVGSTPVTPLAVQAEQVAEVVMNSEPENDEPPAEILDGCTQGSVTQYGDWKRIDQEEIRRGEVLGKERERMGWEEACHFFRSD